MNRKGVKKNTVNHYIRKERIQFLMGRVRKRNGILRYLLMMKITGMRTSTNQEEHLLNMNKDFKTS